MSGPIVSVDPTQISAFVRNASTQFSAAVQALNAINQTASSATFTGRNAILFKTEVQDQLTTFVKATTNDLVAVTEASNNACKGISASLGETVSISPFNSESMTELSTQGGASAALTLDYTSMRAVSTSLNNNIETVQTTLRNHKKRFVELDWRGKAKDDADKLVIHTCDQGLNKCTAAADLINQKIVAQVEATSQADQTVG